MMTHPANHNLERPKFRTQFAQMIKFSHHEAIRVRGSPQLSSLQTLIHHGAGDFIQHREFKCVVEVFTWAVRRTPPPEKNSKSCS